MLFHMPPFPPQSSARRSMEPFLYGTKRHGHTDMWAEGGTPCKCKWKLESPDIYMYVNVCYILIYMFASCSCGSFGQKVKYLCISNTQISNYLTVQQCTYLSISIDLSFYSSIHRVQTGVQPVPTDWCPNGWDDWTRTDGFLGRYGSIYWVPK